MAKAIHIFNPEHDYALATFSPYFTAPKVVRAFRNAAQFLPILWAKHGDILLVDAPDENIRQILATPLAKLKEIAILRKDFPVTPEISLTPWGWDPAIYHEISEKFASLSPFLPSKSLLKEIRRLSHRRLTIKFNDIISKIIPTFYSDSIIPKEVFDTEEAMTLYDACPHCFFKAPWSSSGRGVMHCSDLIRDKHILPWVHGVIRHQGSVMWESTADKAIDFASEWWVKDGEVRYLGLSVFDASGRGKYHGNLVASEDNKTTYISANAPLFSSSILDAQRMAISSLIAPYYNGPVGIDMLADKKGHIRPCVEVNLRYTMGHAAIRIQEQFSSGDEALGDALIDFLQEYDSLSLFQISQSYE